MTQVTCFCSCLSSSSLLLIPQIQSCPKMCLLVFPVSFPLHHMKLCWHYQAPAVLLAVGGVGRDDH